MDTEAIYFSQSIKKEDGSCVYIEAVSVKGDQGKLFSISDPVSHDGFRDSQGIEAKNDIINYSSMYQCTEGVKEEQIDAISVNIIENSDSEHRVSEQPIKEEAHATVTSMDVVRQQDVILYDTVTVKQEVKSEPIDLPSNGTADLYKIVKVRVANGLYMYECQVCKKRHAKRGRADVCLMNHRGEKPFSCKKCGHRFTEICKLRRHMLIHSGERAHKCKTCDKTFALKYNLKKHELIHEKIRPYMCQICNKSFTQKGNLTTHMKIHLKLPINHENYLCRKCGKNFKRLCFLESHMSKKCFKTERETYLNEEECNVTNANLQCEICDTVFKYKKSLTRHKLKHGISVNAPNALAPVCSEKCCTLDIIEKSFADIFFKAIRNRKKVHISCFMCNRTLHSPVSFYHHVKTVHSDEDHTANLVSCSECGAVIDFSDTIELAVEWLRHKCVPAITAKGPGRGTITLQKVIIEVPNV